MSRTPPMIPMIPIGFIRPIARLFLAACGVLVLAACAPQPFASERAYISSLLGHAQRTLDQVNSLHTLATQPRLDDPAWYSEIADKNDQLQALIGEARQMQSPANLADVHQRYLGVMDSLEQATSNLDQAAQLRNNETIQQARRSIDQAGASIEQLRQRVNALSDR
ncbi:MAG: hypothetical protein HC828_17310 [Blastochloris sp.]|nr:hypothetical protein [Blastochloris sp.]